MSTPSHRRKPLRVKRSPSRQFRLYRVEWWNKSRRRPYPILEEFLVDRETLKYFWIIRPGIPFTERLTKALDLDPVVGGYATTPERAWEQARLREIYSSAQALQTLSRSWKQLLSIAIASQGITSRALAWLKDRGS